MHIVIAIIGAIFAFLIIVIVHEYGHFIVARCVGIKVLRFSIGFGKPIFKHRAKSGVEYVIGFLPLGGYVKMQDAFSAAENLPGSSGDAFENKSLFARIAVVLAGPIANLLLAFFIFMIVFTIGVTQMKPIVGKVAQNSLAEKVGLKSGDHIIQIGNWKTHDWQRVLMFFIGHIGENKNFPIIVLPKNSQISHTHTINLAHWEFNPMKPDLFGSIGITPTDSRFKEQYPWYLSPKPAYIQTEQWVVFHLIVLKQMLLGRISPKTMGGPVSIFQTAGNASLAGLITYLQFIALLSVVLGVLNLMPIPALDGGHFLFFVIEAVIQRPLPARIQILLTNAGVLFLISLMLFATLNDFTRLFQ